MNNTLTLKNLKTDVNNTLFHKGGNDMNESRKLTLEQIKILHLRLEGLVEHADKQVGSSEVSRGRHKKDGKLMSFKLSSKCIEQLDWLAKNSCQNRTKAIELAVEEYFNIDCLEIKPDKWMVKVRNCMKSIKKTRPLDGLERDVLSSDDKDAERTFMMLRRAKQLRTLNSSLCRHKKDGKRMSFKLSENCITQMDELADYYKKIMHITKTCLIELAVDEYYRFRFK